MSLAGGLIDTMSLAVTACIISLQAITFVNVSIVMEMDMVLHAKYVGVILGVMWGLVGKLLHASHR